MSPGFSEAAEMGSQSSRNFGSSFSGWWFGCHFLFSHILGISSSQLTFIFFRGVAQPPSSFPFWCVSRRERIGMDGNGTMITLVDHSMPDFFVGKPHVQQPVAFQRSPRTLVFCDGNSCPKQYKNETCKHVCWPPVI